MMSRRAIIVLLVICIAAVAGASMLFFRKHAVTDRTPATTVTQDADSISYLPLGDSYTIGQSVAESERWPNQLAAAYKPARKTLRILDNPAVTGYTTQDLIDTELPLVRKLRPDFVTVQFGVNDYVQGVSEQTFRKNLDYIVSFLQTNMKKPQNILLVTIPDYAKTPTGARYGDPSDATTAIQRFNDSIIATAASANIPAADVFAESQKVAHDPSLIAPDGLHPSGREYSQWVAIIIQSLTVHAVPQ